MRPGRYRFYAFEELGDEEMRDPEFSGVGGGDESEAVDDNENLDGIEFGLCCDVCAAGE